jgi:hypothetical protein
MPAVRLSDEVEALPQVPSASARADAKKQPPQPQGSASQIKIHMATHGFA